MVTQQANARGRSRFKSPDTLSRLHEDEQREMEIKQQSQVASQMFSQLCDLPKLGVHDIVNGKIQTISPVKTEFIYQHELYVYSESSLEQ